MMTTKTLLIIGCLCPLLITGTLAFGQYGDTKGSSSEGFYKNSNKMGLFRIPIEMPRQPSDSRDGFSEDSQKYSMSNEVNNQQKQPKSYENNNIINENDLTFDQQDQELDRQQPSSYGKRQFNQQNKNLDQQQPISYGSTKSNQQNQGVVQMQLTSYLTKTKTPKQDQEFNQQQLISDDNIQFDQHDQTFDEPTSYGSTKSNQQNQNLDQQQLTSYDSTKVDKPNQDLVQQQPTFYERRQFNLQQQQTKSYENNNINNENDLTFDQQGQDLDQQQPTSYGRRQFNQQDETFDQQQPTSYGSTKIDQPNQGFVQMKLTSYGSTKKQKQDQDQEQQQLTSFGDMQFDQVDQSFDEPISYGSTKSNQQDQNLDQQQPTSYGSTKTRKQNQGHKYSASYATMDDRQQDQDLNQQKLISDDNIQFDQNEPNTYSKTNKQNPDLDQQRPTPYGTMKSNQQDQNFGQQKSQSYENMKTNQHGFDQTFYDSIKSRKQNQHEPKSYGGGVKGQKQNSIFDEQQPTSYESMKFNQQDQPFNQQKSTSYGSMKKQEPNFVQQQQSQNYQDEQQQSEPGQVYRAAVQTRHSVDYRDVDIEPPNITPPTILVEANRIPLNILFQSKSTKLNIMNDHSPGKGSLQESNSEDEPHRLIHRVTKPIYQEIYEIITPYRKIRQEINPVQEEIQTVVARMVPQDKQNNDNDNSNNYGSGNNGQGYANSETPDYNQVNDNNDNNNGNNFNQQFNNYQIKPQQISMHKIEQRIDSNEKKPNKSTKMSLPNMLLQKMLDEYTAINGDNRKSSTQLQSKPKKESSSFGSNNSMGNRQSIRMFMNHQKESHPQPQPQPLLKQQPQRKPNRQKPEQFQAEPLIPNPLLVIDEETEDDPEPLSVNVPPGSSKKVESLPLIQLPPDHHENRNLPLTSLPAEDDIGIGEEINVPSGMGAAASTQTSTRTFKAKRETPSRRIALFSTDWENHRGMLVPLKLNKKLLAQTKLTSKKLIYNQNYSKLNFKSSRY